MRVEFFGPPGVGKTYLRQRFLTEYTSRLKIKLRVNHIPLPPEYEAAIEAVRVAYETRCVVPKRMKTGPEIFERRAKLAAGADKSEHIVMLDESLLQAVISFSYACKHNTEYVKELARFVPPPALAVYCNTAPGVILKRNAGREKNWGENALRCNPSLEVLFNLVDAETRAIHIDTQYSVESNMVKLSKELKCLIS